MESKDLNTYINDKLNQGSGIRYQEEYWNDMNNLLDAHMPVVQPEISGTQPAVQTNVQTVSTGLKWAAFSSAGAAIVTAAVMYFQPFKNDQPVPTETTGTKTTLGIPQSQSETTSETQYTQNEKVNTLQHNNTEPTSQHNTLTPSENTSIQKNSQAGTSKPFTTSSNLPVYTTQPGTSDPHIHNGPGATEIPHGGSFVAATSDQNISSQTIELLLIDPISRTTANKNLGDNKPVSFPAPKRNKLITQIAVSPFAGWVFEKGEQSYQSGNISYIHPAQTNQIYGINVECATKQFVLRTGIGWSSTGLETTITNSENIYDVDTHYVILDPHYGTTPSGKPIALIQRQIDSSYVSTEHTTSHEHTTYQYLSIPITLQYRIGHKRVSLVFEGGGIHQIMVSQQNSTPQQPNTENRAVLPVYSFQLTAGSSVHYAISSKWAVGVQYDYNLNPSSANLHFLNNNHVATVTLTRNIR
jgi:hypothetical protein